MTVAVRKSVLPAASPGPGEYGSTRSFQEEQELRELRRRVMRKEQPRRGRKSSMWVGLPTPSRHLEREATELDESSEREQEARGALFRFA